MMVALKISLLLTVVAVLCQAVAVFLPGWLVPSEDKYEKTVDQIGVWFSCREWKNCTVYVNTLKDIKRSAYTPITIQQLILMALESTAFLLLLSSTTICGMAVCAKKRSKLVRAHSGCNVASSFLILGGLLCTVTVYGELNDVALFYGYSFFLASVAAILSLISGMICCCAGDSDGKSRSRRQDKHYDQHYDQQNYYPEYQQQNYPMGYGGAAPFYG